jgi:hypothetical protein
LKEHLGLAAHVQIVPILGEIRKYTFASSSPHLQKQIHMAPPVSPHLWLQKAQDLTETTHVRVIVPMEQIACHQVEWEDLGSNLCEANSKLDFEQIVSSSSLCSAALSTFLVLRS